MQVQPYLDFDGRCEEALAFYKTALGAQVKVMMRYKESPDPKMCTVEDVNKIMHSAFAIGDTQLMASDGQCKGQVKFEGFSLSLNPATEAEAERLFAALAEGGQVQMPLASTFFASRFGMVRDRFGVSWIVIVALK